LFNQRRGPGNERQLASHVRGLLATLWP